MLCMKSNHSVMREHRNDVFESNTGQYTIVLEASFSSHFNSIFGVMKSQSSTRNTMNINHKSFWKDMVESHINYRYAVTYRTWLPLWRPSTVYEQMKQWITNITNKRCSKRWVGIKFESPHKNNKRFQFEMETWLFAQLFSFSSWIALNQSTKLIHVHSGWRCECVLKDTEWVSETNGLVILWPH